MVSKKDWSCRRLVFLFFFLSYKPAIFSFFSFFLDIHFRGSSSSCFCVSPVLCRITDRSIILKVDDDDGLAAKVHGHRPLFCHVKEEVLINESVVDLVDYFLSSLTTKKKGKQHLTESLKEPNIYISPQFFLPMELKKKADNFQ